MLLAGYVGDAAAFVHSQPDLPSAVTPKPLLCLDTARATVVRVAKELTNSASSLSDPVIERARSCLAVFMFRCKRFCCCA